MLDPLYIVRLQQGTGRLWCASGHAKDGKQAHLGSHQRIDEGHMRARSMPRKVTLQVLSSICLPLIVCVNATKHAGRMLADLIR